MKKYIEPKKEQWEGLCQRPYQDQSAVESVVREIMMNVKDRGDDAIRAYSREFDGVELHELKVSAQQIDESQNMISNDLKSAIALAKSNIEAFHMVQKEQTVMVETMEGVTCWRKSVPIEKVGLYIPGGSAPLFSTLLMLVIPAKLAGCREIVVCTPANAQGEIHPAVLYTASVLGIRDIYKVGGAQAIAGMTYGTQSIPQVYKLFGPGNQYVTMAKQLAQQEGLAIDMPAGPSELLVVADELANASFIAADLLSQAEHGPDSQVVLIAPHTKVLEVEKELASQVENLPRKDIAKQALDNSLMIAMEALEDAIALSNLYAPEHLIINTVNADALLNKIVNAGSVFVGAYSCESIGDYASGTNHTLPTNYYARNYSGVSVDSFVRKITFQKVTGRGIKNIGPAVELMAQTEELQGHQNAVTVRLKAMQNESR